MADLKTKQRLYKTIRAAKEYLDHPKNMWNVIILDDTTCPFHLERSRRSEERGRDVQKFRVVLDEITDDDIKACQNFVVSRDVFTKAILVKKPNARNFEYHEL